MSKELNFKSLEALSPLEKVINEAGAALQDPERTISTSAIPEVLGSVVGAGIGAAGSFYALVTLGTAGLSAAGITSGLAGAGAVIGGGMVAGIGVLAAPIAGLAVLGYGILASRKKKQLIQTKELLLKKAIQMRDGIINQLKIETDANKDRLEYLNAINIMLQAAVHDLQADLAMAK